jgi:hypothetical protein
MWVDNITMDLAELGCSDVDWIDLAQDTNRWRALGYLTKHVNTPCEQNTKFLMLKMWSIY